MTCTKKRFVTKRDAREYARRKASDPTFEHRGKLSVYRCPHEECAVVGFWHLTSIGARDRGFARKNARQGSPQASPSDDMGGQCNRSPARHGVGRGDGLEGA